MSEAELRGPEEHEKSATGVAVSQQSHIAARYGPARDVTKSEAWPDGRAGADGLGADRARHGDAGAIKPADHALVGTQHLAMPVGAWPAFGADTGIEKRCREEGRLLDRAERPVGRIVALPRRLAAMEVAVDAVLRPAVEAIDRGAKLLRIEIDLPGQALERVRLAHEAWFLRGVVHAQRVSVAGIKDAPHRQVPGLAIGPAFVERRAESRAALAGETLAVAVHQDAVRRVGLIKRLGVAMAFVLGEGHGCDVRLIHMGELGAGLGRHALAVAGVAARRSDQVHVREISRDVIRRPVEAAGRQDHALGSAKRL